MKFITFYFNKKNNEENNENSNVSLEDKFQQAIMFQNFLVIKKQMIIVQDLENKKMIFMLMMYLISMKIQII